MIDNKTLDIEWIKEVSVKNRKVDKILVEKVIRALYLLEGLAKVDLDFDDVIEDIIQTSLCIVSRGVSGNGDFGELQAGIQRVSRFIFSEPFHLDKAITMASKAAYIANTIRYNKNKIEIFNNPLQMKEWNIVDPLWPRLNRLKKSNPEAFFYWYKIHKIVQENIG